MEFHKDLYSDLCFLIYLFVIFFFIMKETNFEVMRMTIRRMLQSKILMMLLSH